MSLLAASRSSYTLEIGSGLLFKAFEFGRPTRLPKDVVFRKDWLKMNKSRLVSAPDRLSYKEAPIMVQKEILWPPGFTKYGPALRGRQLHF